MSLGVSTVEAGCKTLFVCYAEEPNALAELDPELHASLAEAAPLKDKARLTAP